MEQEDLMKACLLSKADVAGNAIASLDRLSCNDAKAHPHAGADEAHPKREQIINRTHRFSISLDFRMLLPKMKPGT